MNFQFRPAVRQDTKPLIGLYGQSGSGKTMSALLLARGIVGPSGRIAMIDTESQRGSLYADVIPGGYETFDLEPPFTPQRYIEAISAAEAADFDCLVVDSASHEWEGLGGILDMAAEKERKAGKKSLNIWVEPKRQHGLMVQKLLRVKMPLIICLRAKHKTRQIKNPATGKSEVVRDDHTSPIQADDFIFEMTLHAEIQMDHTIRLTKCSHPELLTCIPDGRSITVEAGEAIAQWAGGSGTSLDSVGLLSDARKAAEGGRDSFQKHWKTLDKPQRAVVNAIMDELKRTALEAGADDNPFKESPSDPHREGAEPSPDADTTTEGETQSPKGGGSTEPTEDELDAMANEGAG